MNEIYRLVSGQTVVFELPAGVTSAEVAVRKNDNLVVLPNGSLSIVNGIAEVIIPFSAVVYDGKLEVDWTFSDPDESVSHTVTTVHDVVTPLFDPKTLEDDETGPDRASEIERQVRLSIQSYTGQYFGLSNETLRVRGRGDNSLILPRRLQTLNGVSSNNVALDPQAYHVAGDGWYLHKNGYGYLEIKEAPPEPVEYWTVGPISVPSSRYGKFYDHTEYLISGLWGYQAVPADVREAALLLAEDYKCGEIAYYDAYLNAVTSADWRTDFKDLRYNGIGNARADMLLAPYKITSAAVI